MRLPLVLALFLSGCGVAAQDQCRIAATQTQETARHLRIVETSAAAARDESLKARQITEGTLGHLNERMDRLSTAIGQLRTAIELFSRTATIPGDRVIQ